MPALGVLTDHHSESDPDVAFDKNTIFSAFLLFFFNSTDFHYTERKYL